MVRQSSSHSPSSYKATNAITGPLPSCPRLTQITHKGPACKYHQHMNLGIRFPTHELLKEAFKQWHMVCGVRRKPTQELHSTLSSHPDTTLCCLLLSIPFATSATASHLEPRHDLVLCVFECYDVHSPLWSSLALDLHSL